MKHREPLKKSNLSQRADNAGDRADNAGEKELKNDELAALNEHQLKVCSVLF